MRCIFNYLSFEKFHICTAEPSYLNRFEVTMKEKAYQILYHPNLLKILIVIHKIHGKHMQTNSIKKKIKLCPKIGKN